ncbi:1548_t:CDS:2, partial [Acaulospora colombiana]
HQDVLNLLSECRSSEREDGEDKSERIAEGLVQTPYRKKMKNHERSNVNEDERMSKVNRNIGINNLKSLNTVPPLNYLGLELTNAAESNNTLEVYLVNLLNIEMKTIVPKDFELSEALLEHLSANHSSGDNDTNESSQNEAIESEIAFITPRCNNFAKEAMFHVVDHRSSRGRDLLDDGQTYDSRKFEKSSTLANAEIPINMTEDEDHEYDGHEDGNPQIGEHL